MPRRDQYFLGHSSEERRRLQQQARELAGDSIWLFEQVPLSVGPRVVEIGCGPQGCLEILSDRVGPTGSVIGIDFVPDMIARATTSAAAAGLSNVRFLEGMIEALPLADESVDVVISNGVVNLSPRKARVLAEAFRVLRAGGRLAIIDLTLEHDLPAEIQTHPAAWAGCLSGAGFGRLGRWRSARGSSSRSTRGRGHGTSPSSARLSAPPTGPSTRPSRRRS